MDSSAVERLIGGDSETEIELRSSIVQAFAKKYLKGVIDKGAISIIETELRATIRTVVTEKIGNASYYGKSTIINPEFKKLIENKVSEEFLHIYLVEFEKQKRSYDEKIRLFTESLNSTIDARISENINKIVDKKVAEKLNNVLKALE